MKRWCLGLSATLFISVLHAADFEVGLKAYESGDYATAIKEFQPLADQGVRNAQYNLGLIFAKGQGVKQDYTEAAKWYRKAAEQGVVEAEYNLGMLYSAGNGVPKDPAEAMKWFIQAAEKGDVQAANSIGTFYDEGEGAFKNKAEAAKWYRKAADQGVANAQFNLGVMYDTGQGVPVNYNEAVKWYQKAAEQNNEGALCNLGILYYNGQGVKLDRLQAHEYFLLAKAGGDPRADNLMQLTTEKLTKKQLAEASEKANSWKQAHVSKPSTPSVPAVEVASNGASTRASGASSVVAKVSMPVVESTAASVSAPVAQIAESSKSVWTGVERVIAVGDVHGDYEQLTAILRSSLLIDNSENWVGGKAHLVQTGDILDRGSDARRVMDLLMKLQTQAAAAGGYVHCLLGSHETMNLYGDLRFVAPSAYGEYSDSNSEKLRDTFYRQYRDQIAKTNEGKEVAASELSRDEWLASHPLGFYEMEAAFTTEGQYGKWLRSLDSVIKINNNLFLHAGLSPKYTRYTLDQINDEVRAELNNPAKLHGGIVTDQEGPFWYRGIAKGDQLQVEPVLDKVLAHFGAAREVVGHSTVEAITPRFNGRVILIDVGLPRVEENTGRLACLLIENGKPVALDEGSKVELPKDEDGADMLRYLKQTAALDPVPSPLLPRIAAIETKIGQRSNP